ncbi:hypothetical protein O3597_25675 [Verrucosispora sp. WMMA2044]|uniref:hypothetical protein n=1 Tax=Verrucosispora sp. WMMA2044 TaxID=3016419 RepID=UPI00248AA23D|nr:hypothetical protein [Verrucosispora sp. WMMA2044]WBB48432.1 hypothetical protein O3597_25675 [Verrucosispora sp. WMMA2044]
MDPISVAIAAMALIAYKGGEAFAAAAGQATWGQLANLVGLIKGRLSKDHGDLAALNQADEDPNDPKNIIRLARALRRNMDRDKAFEIQLTRLTREISATSARTDHLQQELARLAEEVKSVIGAEVVPAREFERRVGKRKPAQHPARTKQHNFGGAVSLGESTARLFQLAEEGLPLRHAADLVDELQKISAQLHPHLNGLPSKTLQDAYSMLQKAEVSAAEAQTAIRRAQEMIKEAVTRFAG